MTDKKKYYDLESERNVLKALLQSKSFCSSTLMYNLIIKEHFTDLFHINSFNAINDYHYKYGKSPGIRHFKKYLIKHMTFHKKFKTKEKQKQIWLKASSRLFNKFNIDNIKEIRAELDYLEELRKARLAQKTFIKMKDKFDGDKFDEAFDIMSESISKSKIVTNTVTEGNIVDDLHQHFVLDKKIKMGEFRPVSSKLIGVMEKENGIKIIDFDRDVLGGGWFAGEFYMFIGQINIGKSFILMEVGFNASKYDKKNVAYFTIEMNKIKSQRRIYTRETGIPYWKFKKGELTKKDKRKLRDSMDRWGEENGIYHVTSFDKGATPQDIVNKTNDIENRYGKAFDLVVVDYVNDLKPPSNLHYDDSKNWSAIGAISEELANFSKYHDNHRGIPVVSANQKKTKYFYSEDTKLGSSQGSALPEAHATVVIGIGQNESDEIIKRIRIDLPKNRDGDKGFSFYMYPDFSRSKINSIKRIKEYYDEEEDEQ